MAITYNLKQEGKVLFVSASGMDDTVEEVKQYAHTVASTAEELKCTGILCDERNLKYRLGTLDTFDLARFVAKIAPSMAKIAIVCSPEDQGDAAFFETVAVNRGLEVKSFVDYERARAWLRV